MAAKMVYKILRGKILEADNISTLENMVREYIRQGWRLQDGVSACIYGTKPYYCQAIVIGDV